MKYLFLVLTAALAQPSIAAEAEDAPAVAVELFTSQSCSSCLAAATYFEELATREDVVALAWHVDYWNTLQTRDGRWIDPYSSAENTERQRQYNRNLRGTSGVYTPQMVVAGASETVGSARENVERLITDAVADAPRATISTSVVRGTETIDITVSGEGEAHIVYFTPSTQTDIRGGENAGVNFNNANIVSIANILGPVAGNRAFSADRPKTGQRCAILLQDPEQGRITAAAYCNAR